MQQIPLFILQDLLQDLGQKLNCAIGKENDMFPFEGNSNLLPPATIA